MLAGVRVLAGPARSGKTTQLLARYRSLLTGEPLASALWLSPTHRAVTEIRQALVDGELGGCLQPQCLTFDQFARRVLDASPLLARSIGPSLVRQLASRLIAEAHGQGELKYFGPIATTRGFLDLAVGTIQEFKRLEIWPEELAQAVGRRPSAKDRELCLIYERYQQRLTAHSLYDAQGRFWQARALLREGQRKPFERLRHVLVDGFTDFTRTEHEMLEILAGRASLTISLLLDDGMSRPDLFVKTAGTLERLKSYHPQLHVEHLPRRRGTWVAMNHLEEHLFANPHQVPATENSAGIEIVPATGAVPEIETIARRIKRLLVHGDERDGGRPVAAQDILVIFRSLADMAETAEEVFNQFGVPVAVGSQRVLGRSPLASALLAWLQLVLDDWPFRQVLAMLGHNGFRPEWHEWEGGSVAAAQQTIYALQIPAGKDELLAGIERLARSDASRAAVAARAHPLVQRMARVLDELPREATLETWRDAMTQLAVATGLLNDRSQPKTPEGGSSSDRQVWDTLLAALAAHEHLGGWLGERPRTYSLQEFYDHLSEILRVEPLGGTRDDTGCVRLLSAEQARNLSAPYVFLAGLSEKAFPPSAREDCVLGEADTSQFIRAGLPLVSHADRPRFEMLLFYEVATRATRRLVLSYPALDARAQTLSPSPYLTELEHTFGAGRIERLPMAELSSVPRSDEVLSLRELRVRALSQALAGQTQLLEGLCRHPTTRSSAGNLVAGLEVARSRQQGTAFGPYEGMLASPAAESLLAKRFGNEHCWSPSQLEQYAYCPYQFLLAHVLRVEPLEELEFEADHRGRGQMLHWLLSTLHRNLSELGALRSPGAQSKAEYLAAAETLVAQFVERAAARGALRTGMLQIDARRVSAWLAAYQAQHRAYDQTWGNWQTPLLPSHFEVAFGPPRRSPAPSDEPEDDIDPLSSEAPFELECQGETIRFAGRIDRIDLGQVGQTAVFNIVDYKSGKPSKRTSLNSVLEGRSLQLPLYALAAKNLLAQQGAQPFRAAYWHVAGEGYREKDAVKFHLDSEGRLELTSEWDQLEKQLRVRVKSLVEGIRHGQFPMHSHDDECTSRCAYRTVCRINQARSLGKQWQPPEEPA